MSWQYFSYEGDKMLACPETGEQGMNDYFMQRLDYLRKVCEFPFIITSGYRSPEYNAKISSTGLTGPHTTGKAVDILVSGKNAHTLIQRATAHGFTGIGISQKGPHESRFIHLDMVTDGPRPWVWSY